MKSKINENKEELKKKTKTDSYLGCKVLWRATESFHGSSVCDALLAETKVSDLHVTVFIQHQVFQLGGKQNETKKQTFTLGLSKVNKRRKEKFRDEEVWFERLSRD